MIDRLSLRRVVWLVPLSFGLHVAEEWPRFVEWAARHASPDFTRHDYVTIHVTGVVVSCLLAALLSWRRNRTVVFLFLAFFFFPSIFWNTVFHLGATLVFRAYCPGVITAVLVYPPLVWLVMRSCRKEGLVTPRSATVAWATAGVFHAWEVGHNVFRAWSDGHEGERVTGKPPRVLAAVTGLLLAGYLGIVGWAWSSSTTDPQAGMAIGFLMLVTLFLLGLAGLLWYAVVHGRRRLVWAVFAVCALPSLSLVARGIYLLVRWLGKAQ